MASQGPLSPATIISETPGDTAWTNPGFAGVSDGSYATCALSLSNTEFLKATACGFTIPAGARIDSIVVEVEKSESAPSANVLDLAVRIVKGGTVCATDFAAIPEWPTTDAYTTYSPGLWGETWTDADINADTFGAAIQGFGDAGSARVDHIRITVNYTAWALPATVEAKMPAYPSYR